MAVPKQKKSKSKSRSRRASYLKIKIPQLHSCSNCNNLKRPYTICPSCGFYKNRLIISQNN